ncbi:MAG: hypothetical protein QOE53_553, partial [Pseudonocardiales bacterium]|nr:hypothetical protein [Pseudonocardiales bacterium]
MEKYTVTTAENPAATESTPNGRTHHGGAVFSGAAAVAQAGGQKPETEQ